ncbi:MAG: 30S ribosomal protein S8 [Deltaproteobacteria bacterium]|nr:30S ribosomal protein S8 [Deltaproteobacteria bacterium]OQX60469.1 MAG: 30S ribosomal protein S8 [Desulfococcus sp. 4484_241]MCD6138480.1 30S ribosomal protein S8 [Deltaproteobacteria bacterium]RLB91740.1 MAG: 30S ribosomal protein S8 [Deltaproteobacteria bacterium]RLB96706.1 MAG: 30S ribosomal protein S8 [Deltaproteobacteria bacterium]
MPVTDSLADMLTRIRNAVMARHNRVDIPSSKMKISLARILKTEGYIKNYKLVRERGHGTIRIYLKYDEARESVIAGLKRVSKPGRRVYVKRKDIPLVLNGMGIAVLSTSKGVLTDQEARKLNVGGELLCHIW